MPSTDMRDKPDALLLVLLLFAVAVAVAATDKHSPMIYDLDLVLLHKGQQQWHFEQQQLQL